MNKTRRIETTVELIRILVAIGIAYGLALITLFAISEDPVYIIQQFVLGPFSSLRRIGSIINLAIPFTFTGLCFCFIYAVDKFNLSGEGIFMFAGCVISFVAITLQDANLPSVIFIPLLIIVGAVVGAVISFIPAYLDVKFRANIVVVSLMMNNILVFLSIWFVKYLMRDTTIGSIGSTPIPAAAKLGNVFGKLKVQGGIFFAVAAVILVSVLFYKMVFGYKIRVVGSNPLFAKASGISMAGTIIAAQLMGGALAGIGGTCEILGNYDRFKWQASTQHGFDGLMVAVLARKNPMLVPVAALLLAYIRIGADVVNSKGDIPIEFITVIQGIIILLVAAEEFMGRFKKKMIYKEAVASLQNDKEQEMKKNLSAEAGKGERVE